MSTLTHAQYNSPMPLYSRDNVQEVVHQTEGFLHGRPQSAGASGQFNPHQSGAYRLLQENGQIAPAHSARLDEEYPHYRGFVDPRVQSPSFKRLQYVTGMDSGAEDEISHELHAPVKSRTDEVRSGAGSRQSAGSQHEYSAVQQQQQQQQQQQEEYKPQWSDEMSGPRVAQRDPTSADRDQPADPRFAARIAEAERPKVPPSVVPNWARKAEEKRAKWQQYGDQMQQRNYEYQVPQADWQSGVNKVQDKWSAHYGTTRLESYENAPRARSTEPYGRSRPTERVGGAKKEWMKPYIAPNVLNTKFGPPSQSSYSPLSSYKNRPSSNPTKPQEFGSYYGPSRPYSSLSTASSTQQRSRSPYDYSTTYAPQRYQTTTTTRSSYQDHNTSNDYGSSPAKKEVNVATLVSGEALNQTPLPPTTPPWSKHAESKRTVWESNRNSVDPEYRSRQASGERPPPWAQRAEQTHSLWQNEADAWRQRQSMESDLRHRATSAGPEPQYGSSGGEQRRYETTTTNTNSRASPSWRQRPVPHEVTSYNAPSSQRWQPAPQEVTSYTGSATPSGQRWQQAPGGETKSQSSGNYLDRDGNQVSFTKKKYTSSDPGKEFSMLTEQEKKILEQPMEPGVVSRHVTTKYYKKSTYNSSSTTSTSQTPPVTTTVRYDQPTTTSTSRFTRGTSEY